MKKRIKIFCDSLTAAMGSIWVGLAVPLCFSIFVYCTVFYDKAGIETLTDKIIVFFIYIVFVGTYAFSVFCTPKWLAFVELDSTGVRLNTIFKKTNKIPWQKYRALQIVRYRHLYHDRFFVVIGYYELPSSELSNANQIYNSEERIKIKLSKRSYKKLCSILPELHREKLKSVWNNHFQRDVFDVETYLKKQRKKKRKKKTK